MFSRSERLLSILKRLPGNDTASQRARMLAAIHELGSVTTFESMRYLDVFDPRPRVYELRHKEGVDIQTVMRLEQTESGVLHRVGVYVFGPTSHKEAA